MIIPGALNLWTMVVLDLCFALEKRFPCCTILVQPWQKVSLWQMDRFIYGRRKVGVVLGEELTPNIVNSARGSYYMIGDAFVSGYRSAQRMYVKAL